MKHIIILMLITWVTSCPEYENCTINSLRQKRDACDDQAISSVSQSVLSILESFSNGGVSMKELFKSSSGSNIIGLFQSVFGFNSPTTCEINQKLDKILKKLDEISHEIKMIENIVECSNLKQEYRNDISKKSQKLLYQFNQYKITHLKQESKKRIIDSCMHETEGISSILSSFIMILQDDHVKEKFKVCFRYQKNETDKWAQKIREFSLIFVSLVVWCEDAYGYETDFDPYLFIQDIENRVNYHMEFTLLESFVNDEGPTGIDNSILNVLKKNKDSKNTVDELKNLYGYFDWGVIQYYKKMFGYDYHAARAYKTSFFGGLHYIRKDGLDKNAFVSWCLPGKADLNRFKENRFNEIMSKYDANSDSCQMDTVVRIFDSYSNLAFAFCVNRAIPYYVNWDSELDYNGNEKAFFMYTQRKDRYRGRKYRRNDPVFDCFVSSSFYKEKPVISSFSNYAIHFPTQKNNLLLTKSLNLNTRLFGHYKHITEASARKCRNVCLNDKDCVASSFAKPELKWTYPCFLFKNGYRTDNDEGWTSYIRLD